RRRHTRFSRDWSSDVCSSDLINPLIEWFDERNVRLGSGSTFNVCPKQNTRYTAKATYNMCGAPFTLTDTIDVTFAADFPLARNRSEERRVGKQGRIEWRRRRD